MDFSIETHLEQINSAKTKEYFKEVYQTFVNGNYRSSIVMLYSVLICDLIYKLRDLRDVYNDTKAGKIIHEIEKMQETNPRSPDWESKLVDKISERLNLFEPSDIVAISSLQKYRHLCAHPILTNTDLLYSPNRDVVRSLIRNILEGVFIQPAFFSSKIFDTFLEDLSDIKDKITDNAGLESYLVSRYLSRMKDPDYKILFRNLWRIALLTEDSPSNENRKINIAALSILLRKRNQVCIDALRSEPDYYSKISKDEGLKRLIFIISKSPKIYSEISDSLRHLVSQFASKDESLEVVAWFLNESLEDHFIALNRKNYRELKGSNLSFLRRISQENGLLDKFVDFAIKYFGESPTFEEAKRRYETAIVILINDISIEKFKELLRVSNNNSQIFGNYSIQPKLRFMTNDRFSGEIDESDYENVFK